MDSRMRRKLKSFTVMEVLIVMAIMGLLVGIIANATNRLSEQLKNSSDISQELNQWYAFRSNLWRELYFSDSMNVEKNELTIFENQREFSYFIDDGFLKRTENQKVIDTKILVKSIEVEQKENKEYIVLDFNWKTESLKMKFYKPSDLSSRVNRYFSSVKQ